MCGEFFKTYNLRKKKTFPVKSHRYAKETRKIGLLFLVVKFKTQILVIDSNLTYCEREAENHLFLSKCEL